MPEVEKVPGFGIDLFALHREVVGPMMRKEISRLQREINHTPKWRKIKRYRLLEALYAEEEAYGLCEHVLGEDGQ